MLKLYEVELWNCVYIVFKLSWLHCLFVSELLVPPLRHTYNPCDVGFVILGFLQC